MHVLTSRVNEVSEKLDTFKEEVMKKSKGKKFSSNQDSENIVPSWRKPQNPIFMESVGDDSVRIGGNDQTVIVGKKAYIDLFYSVHDPLKFVLGLLFLVFTKETLQSSNTSGSKSKTMLDTNIIEAIKRQMDAVFPTSRAKLGDCNINTKINDKCRHIIKKKSSPVALTIAP